MTIPRRWFRYSTWALSAVFVLIVAACLCDWLARHPVATPSFPAGLPDAVANFYLGQTKEQIIQRLGAPRTQYQGRFYPMPASDSEPDRLLRLETLIYERADGILYIVTDDTPAGRVCIESTWCPAGMVIE